MAKSYAGNVDPENPVEVPVQFGKRFQPFPLPHPKYEFTSVKWYWYPGFRIDIRFVLNTIIVLCPILAFILLFVKGKLQVKVAFRVILLVIAAGAALLRTNIAVNQIIRTVLCHAYYKSLEAREIWNPQTTHETLLAKDVFHEEKSITGDIRVLRDGTVELHARRNIDEESNSNLPAAMKNGTKFINQTTQEDPSIV